MRILVTNDDGVGSPGLWALARELAKVGEVIVAAPNRDMSGSAAAMLLRRPVRVRPARPPRDLRHLTAFALNTPPASCVLVALRGALGPGRFDLVVSGINTGANLGRDAILSGTVGAALMAALEGVPAMAVSIARDQDMLFTTPAVVAARLARRMHAAEKGEPLLLNLNLPNLPLEQVKGALLTNLSRDCCLTRLTVAAVVERPHTFRLVTERQVPQPLEEGTDEWAVANGYASLTPLVPEVAFDLSDPRVAEWTKELLPLGELAEGVSHG